MNKKSGVEIGARFGLLTVLSINKEPGEARKVACLCECGTTMTISAHRLIRAKSCGCLIVKPTLDMIGKKFGSLTVIEIARNRIDKDKCVMVKCRCDCGKESFFNSRGIRRGSITSCCRYTKIGGYKGIPGNFWTKTKWCAKKRQLNFEITPQHAFEMLESQNYKCRYSGLVINLSRDIKERTASIDRIDSDIGYVEGNIQWVHKDINRMKSNFSEDKFLEYIRLINEKHMRDK